MAGLSKATRAAPAVVTAAAAASVTLPQLADATPPPGEVESATINAIPRNTTPTGEESAPASATVAPKPAADATIPPAPPPTLVIEAVLTSDAASPVGGSDECAPRARDAEPSCPLAIPAPAAGALATGDARRLSIIDDGGAGEEQGPAAHQSTESGGADASVLNRKKRRSLKRIDTARAALAQAVAEITAERQVVAASSAVAASTDPPWAVARDPPPLASILTGIAPCAEDEVARAALQPSGLAQPPRSGQKRRRRRVSLKAGEGGPPPADGGSTSDAAAPAALAVERGLDGSSAVEGRRPGADSEEIPLLPPPVTVGPPRDAERDDDSAAAQPPQPLSHRKKKRRKSRAGANAVLAQKPVPVPTAPVPGPSRRPPHPAPQPVAGTARPLPPPDFAHHAPRGATGVGRGDRWRQPEPLAAAVGTQRDSQVTASGSLQSAEPKKRPLVLPPGVRKAMVTAKPRSRP